MKNKKVFFYLLLILIIIITSVGLILVFRPTQKKAQFQPPAENIIQITPVPTSVLPKTNPFEINTNPFR